MSSILIVGSYGSFTNELINKFYKENWRIYTLICNKKLIKPAHVFEQYVFKYDSDSVRTLINSSRPDVILFTGAYDPYYKWEDESAVDDSLNYVTGLSNLLMSAAMLGTRHFIYISSEKVFEDEYIIDIKEDLQTSPNSVKGMTISQGENLAMHFNQTTQMEVSVIRLAGMYGIPADRKACRDIYSGMCLKALVSGRLQVNAKKGLSALFVKDAVEGLYLLAKAPERKHVIYHISSLEEVTEDMVARLIQEKLSNQIDIVDQTVGLKSRLILSNSRFLEEFPLEIRNSYKDIIPQIIMYMNRHKNLFLHSDEKYQGKGLGHRVLRVLKKAFPFLESLVFFIPFFILNNQSVGNDYFGGINFYLLYVLLFAVIHGRQQAILASLLSVIGYCYRQLYSTSGFSLLIDINTYIWIAQIFVVGLTVGHLKDKFRDMEADKNEQIDFLSERLNDITVINSSNIKIKNYYAEKIISSTESIGRIYDITSRLDKAATGEVLFAALDTLSEIMNTPNVSIYLVSNTSYCRLATASSEKARSLGKSVSMGTYHVIFDVLKEKQVYINRTLDSNLPMMASALFDEKGNMRIVIFLWEIPYEQMTLYQANLLTIVGALVYSVVVRDADYLDALAYRRFIPDTAILQESAYHEMLEIYRHAAKKGYADLCEFYVHPGNKPLKELSGTIKPLLRETDYIGAMADGSLAILLTNTNEAESVYVRKRLEEKNIKTYLEKEL
ncbi:sugar nucleotide-binding protein [Clostridium sp. KNHs205]|uniref:sugar nucleotide-binding protein n=1 Tax=Clostridium sp. KNHs205 TaxID=1449050 RepID=UPI00051C08D1|nr:sugar nucleotide-binding protein [Clostridium sp. KNHs205]